MSILSSYLYLSHKGITGVDLLFGVVVYGVIGGEILAFFAIALYAIFLKK